MLIALVMVFFTGRARKRQSVLKNNIARIAAIPFDNYKIGKFCEDCISRQLYGFLCLRANSPA
jgi:hypothetical protein